MALYLGVVQFFLLASWTVYAIFLPGLLDSVGIEKRWVAWVLLADQALFACFDIAAGFAADRAFRLYARMGFVLAAVGALSCAAFLILPWLPGAGVGPALFLGVTVLWVVSSAALRAPLFGLLARHAAKPAVPRLAGLAMAGMGVAAALSPYMGTLLTGLDPRLPFAVSSLSLLLVVLGLVVAERRGIPDTTAAPEAPTPALSAWAFLPALWLAAGAMQIAVFLQAAPRYLRDVGQDALPWLLPIFWVGFSLVAFFDGSFSARWGAARVFALGCLMGGFGIWLTGLTGFEAAISGYALAGLGWAAALKSIFGLAAESGRPERVGSYTGLVFAVLAGAAFMRIGINLTGWPGLPERAPLLTLVSLGGWVLAGLTIWLLDRRLRGRLSAQGGVI